jgi:dTDP-4-dehydrorhamnose reductase
MTEKRIFVLGTSGMLGRYVWKYLTSKGYTVIQVNRDVLNASNMTEEKLRAIFEVVLHVKSGDVVINCIGTIKPRVDSLGDLNAIIVNSVFPRILANVCETLGVNMIHPTTDCVYTGAKGSYNETDKYDVNDVYGMSKALGEPNNCTVIRTSIIGEEVGQTRSLVEWVKSMKDSEVFGFTNHYWNGVTCLQFAKICDGIITVDGFWKGIKHLHSNVLDKKQLVETISEVYDLNIKVNPKETPLSCDRSLSTINHENLKAFNIPTLMEQIKEMKEFSKTLYS